LLDAASKSIEASLDVNENDDTDVLLVSDTDYLDDIIQTDEATTTLSQEIRDSSSNGHNLHIDENDSVQYIVKPMFPGYMFKLPTLPCEPEYDEKNIAMNTNMDASDLSITSNPEHDVSKDCEQKSSSHIGSVMNMHVEETNVKEPMEIPVNKEKTWKTIVYKAPVDTWWPSNNTIRRERRLQGYRSDEDEDEDKNVKISGLPGLAPSMHDRLSNHIEPGILEKLPHCKIHKARVEQQKNHPNPGPLFCIQVTEAYCTEVMLCCSICHTWRHAACGGHFTKFKPHSSKDENKTFSPICDRCYAEKKISNAFPQAQVRIKKQRIENLRRALSTTSVVRHFSFAKHGGTYKWPLGSVSATHIGGHTRSVHARHERSEKQWNELAMKLGNGLGYRPKERVKVRTRELERLIVSIEDAEGETDRHNMMLFLHNDVRKEHPVGFRKGGSSRNFFDPAEDISDAGDENWHDLSKGKLICKETQTADKTKAKDTLEGTVNIIEEEQGAKDTKHVETTIATCESDNSQKSISKIDPDSDDDSSIKSASCDGSCAPSLEEDEDLVSEKKSVSRRRTKGESTLRLATESKIKGESEVSDARQSDWSEKSEATYSKPQCAKYDCKRRPRFDSIFCSDSCGVAALEYDLLRSFEYASDIHPSLLRA